MAFYAAMQLRPTIIAAFIGVSAGLSASPSFAATLAPMSCPADQKLAILIAGSDLVWVGKMDVPKERLLAESRKAAPDYLEIPTHIDEVLKGGRTDASTVRFYPKDAPYKPSNEAVLSLAGAPAVLFLTRVDEGPVGLYFAGYSPESLEVATERTVGAVRTETARQQDILRSWRPDTTLPRFSEVHALIASLGRVNGEDQQRVFNRLEALGKEAVPAIIAQMDDRRALRTAAISLANHSPDAFESVRHYGPEQVVDGLDAVLNQITGQSFGSIMNGGSDRQRDAAIAGWRVYAADRACGKPA
jgi:hypothetical protein